MTYPLFGLELQDSGMRRDASFVKLKPIIDMMSRNGVEYLKKIRLMKIYQCPENIKKPPETLFGAAF